MSTGHPLRVIPPSLPSIHDVSRKEVDDGSAETVQVVPWHRTIVVRLRQGLRRLRRLQGQREGVKLGWWGLVPLHPITVGAVGLLLFV